MKDSNSPLRVHTWRTRSWSVKKLELFWCLLAVGLILIFIYDKSHLQTAKPVKNTHACEIPVSSDERPLKTIVPVKNAQAFVIPGSSNDRPLKTIVPVKNTRAFVIPVTSNERPLKTIIPVKNAQAFVIPVSSNERPLKTIVPVKNTRAFVIPVTSNERPLKTIIPVKNAQAFVIPVTSNERPLKTIIPVKNAQAFVIPGSSNERPLKTIIPVKNAQAFVISAYFDDRFPPPVVRIIGIVDRQQSNQSLYCHLRFHNETISVEAEVDIHLDHFGFRYGTADLKCKCPGITLNSSVSVTTSLQNNASAPHLSIRNIKKGNPSHFTYEFAVCISVMFRNYSNVLQFIQTIEMHRLLGVQKVFIYKTSSSRELDKVLGHYIKEGIVEVIPWQITSFIDVSHSWKPKAGGEIHYNGQIAALNDCVYRNMYTSRYVALTDLDEIIIPRKHSNWGDLMKFLKKQYPYKEGFLFDEHHFSNSVDGDRFAYKEWNNVPGVNILRHIYSEPVNRKSNARKMILNPRTVVQTSVHHCLKCIDRKLFVTLSSDIAWLHHYRYAYKTHLGSNKLIKDTTLWNYSDQLIKNVNSVLQATHILQATQ